MTALLSRFLKPNQALTAEKSRLEAFLSAFPGQYCGWSQDGLTIAYSRTFPKLLGLEHIDSIQDILTVFESEDALSLETAHSRLRDTGQSFSLKLRTRTPAKRFHIQGRRGISLNGADSFDVLWLNDISEQAEDLGRIQNDLKNLERELEQVQAALDALTYPAWIRNERGELVWCNKAYADSVNISPSQVIAEQKELPLTAIRKRGKKEPDEPPHDALPGPDLAAYALRSGQAGIARCHIILAGQRRLYEIREIPLKNRTATIGIGIDRTYEEDLEAVQKRAHAANRELLEQLGSAIAIYGADQKLEFYNTAFARLWHLEEPWLNARPKIGEILEKLREMRRLPEQADFRSYKKIWLGWFTDLMEPHEDLIHLPDGSTLRMLVLPHPMGGLMTILEDVTSRLELESSYNTLIAVQKETLDNLIEAVVVYGGDGRVRLWNPSFAKMWSLNPEDLERGPHISVVVEKMLPNFDARKSEQKKEKLLEMALSREQSEGQLVLANERLIDFATVPLPDGGVLITMDDITDTARVEQALRERNSALETAERLKVDFLANVSYQLRTPLNAIMGFAEILQQGFFGSLNERQNEYAGAIHEAGGVLLGLINDILDLSTIEAGYFELSQSEVNVRGLLNSIYDLTHDWAQKEKIQVKMSCSRNAGSFQADERRMKQVLLNLMRNAITYTGEGGKITLNARRDDDALYISVSDTGIGIPEDVQERIFEPFHRGDTQNTEDPNGVSGGGAGLGLALVRNIVRLHQGRITIDSKPGKGTKITLVFDNTESGSEQK